MRPIRKFSIYQCKDGFYIRINIWNPSTETMQRADEYACSSVWGIYRLIKTITGLK
jgi:hypothetical protein